jgi:hypothetical protein
MSYMISIQSASVTAPPYIPVVHHPENRLTTENTRIGRHWEQWNRPLRSVRYALRTENPLAVPLNVVNV